MTDLLTDSPTFNSLLKKFNPKITPSLKKNHITNTNLTFHYGLTPLSQPIITTFKAVIKELKNVKTALESINSDISIIVQNHATEEHFNSVYNSNATNSDYEKQIAAMISSLDAQDDTLGVDLERYKMHWI